MKKIGILTINDNNNYGNRLQNYAVQQILKKMNTTPYTIINTTSFLFENENYIIKTLKKIKRNIIRQKATFYRKKYFRQFNKNIVFYKKKISEKKIPTNLDSKFDYFVVGSDQVWNPNFNRLSSIDFASFANNKKKISFSASIGINNIPNNYKELFKTNIPNFKNLSVREEEAKKILAEYANKQKIEVLIDPTMLLRSNEWEKKSKKPKQYKKLKNKKYILNYFLGEISEKNKRTIETFARKNNCEIINILDKKDPFYKTGPSEFLFLEKNAFLICTDSFHSSVFSILFNRPFIIFNRNDSFSSMSSRIDTLLSKFKLEDRRFNGNEITKENLKHDYTEAYKILEKERKKSEDFLKKALEIE